MNRSLHHALIHLRLPFSLVLMPLFLWGLYLAAPVAQPGRALLGFLLVHLALYGGMNAFNSYYDRDDGPIGALAAPPPIDRTVLSVGLTAKGVALLGAIFVGREFAGLVLGAILLSVLYSHRRFRWKERPLLALLTIFVGQGVLGALWGWTAAGRPLSALGALEWLAVLGAAGVTSGLYPLTGTYQIEQDRRRGSRTLAVALGLAGSFRVGGLLSALGGIGVGALLAVRGLWLPLGLAAGWAVAAALWTLRWQVRFPRLSVRENQGELMKLAYRNGLFFTALFGALLWLAQR